MGTKKYRKYWWQFWRQVKPEPIYHIATSETVRDYKELREFINSKLTHGFAVKKEHMGAQANNKDKEI